VRRLAALLTWLAARHRRWRHQAAPLPALDFEPPAPAPTRCTASWRRRTARYWAWTAGHSGYPASRAKQITLLGFIYTTCVDPEGCPLAYRVFDDLKQSIGARPALRDQVQLVTLSFDPARDTPAVMQRYAGSRVKEDDSGVRWYFLTTRSARELMPLVEGFGQDVRWTVDRSSGQPRRELSHVLKVFLIDRAGFIREIYSSTFLHPRTVLNDIETLRLER
jgi:cytochrome oxidase Cu insertion factor (SCO1/SenC/PrrC family)